MTAVADRFWSKVALGGIPAHAPWLGPCLVWTAAQNGRGYGAFYLDGRRVQAHHAARVVLGLPPIPDGQEPDHACRVKLCIRPDHTQAVTHAENVARAAEAGAGAQAYQTAKETCPAGHPLDMVDGRGARRCRRCRREQTAAARRRWRERKRQERHAAI